MRILIKSATKNSNYNLKYFNVLADDHQAPVLKNTRPVNLATDVVTSGKVLLTYDEAIKMSASAKGKFTNLKTNAATYVTPVVTGNVACFTYSGLDKSCDYSFELPAKSVSDLAGNVNNEVAKLTFTTAATDPIKAPTIESKNHLWYNKPANFWEEALPLGNGRLGVMHSGGVACDTLQLNEDTFWDQGPNTNYNANAKNVLKQVQNGIFAKNYASVQDLAVKNWMSQGSHGASYRAAGVVLLGFPGQRFDYTEQAQTSDAVDAQGYVRYLDMNTATSHVDYHVDGVGYKRTVFTSFKDNVTVVRLEADQAGKLNFNVCYTGCNKSNIEKLLTNTLYDNPTIKATMGVRM